MWCNKEILWKHNCRYSKKIKDQSMLREMIDFFNEKDVAKFESIFVF